MHKLDNVHAVDHADRWMNLDLLVKPKMFRPSLEG
jgi:hypothetical protein